MLYRRTLLDGILDAFNHLTLIIIAFVCVYPFLYVLFASFSDPLELMKHQGILYRSLGFTLRGYEKVIENPNILQGYRNTILYVVVGTALNILMTSIGAYVVSRKRARLAKYLMFYILFTMFFHGGLIPFYIILQRVKLLDTRAVIILNGAIISWNLIVMRTSFQQIPDSLEESARMDGAHDFTILFRIILPVARATVAVMVLFYAVGRWNEWFISMILLRDRTKYPLQLILREILIINNTGGMSNNIQNPQEEDLYRNLLQYTTVIVSILPILLLYPFLQQYFVKGVMIGSLKG